jgi:hypothetical protein
MNKKVFVFCIGGTGERVMKSITMLMASGMSTNGFTVVPIIIDPHLALEEKKNLQLLIDKYIDAYHSLSLDGKGPDGFFNSEMAWINSLDTQTNDTTKAAGDDRSFAEFLNTGELNTNSMNHYLIQTLYSTENLNSKLSVGFRGNPNVGTVVLQEILEGASWFDAFKRNCGDEDRVFIISSIFGGTGASGYPLLERKIRNTQDSETVPNVFMGAVTVLPYYGLKDPKKNNSKIDSANFMTKAKAALTYYEKTVKSDLLYYVGETTLQQYHENNEETQPDAANFIELVAATSLFHFLQQPSKPKERQYLTRAIEQDVPSLDLSTAGKGYAPLVKCMADFSILNMLLGVLRKEKYFPLKQTYGFNEEFYNSSLSNVNAFADFFTKWYEELSSTKRSFAPIADINRSMMSSVVKGKVLDATDDSFYLLELLKNSKKSTSNKVRDFMDYAYKAINTYTKKILTD